MIFFLVLLVLDIATKMLALGFIPPLQGGIYPFGGVPIFSDFLGISFSLNTAFNTGAAWGLFSDYPGILFFIRISLILGVGLFIYFFQRSLFKTIPFWAVLAGAVGNALDYLLYGHVIDFFHFIFWGYSFPIFNIADSCISLGVLGLLFLERRYKKAALR